MEEPTPAPTPSLELESIEGKEEEKPKEAPVSASVPNLPKPAKGKSGRAHSNSPAKAAHENKVMLHSRRSTSMLHELQDYIKGVEAVAAERKEQLEKVFEDKRDQERKERLQRQNCRSHENDYANFANLMDMPTKLRALHEDLKSQKDKVKKYKDKSMAGDRAILMQEKQIQRLRENLKVVSEALAAVGKNAKQVFEEQKLMETISVKETEIQDLEHRLGIVMKSREVDLKRSRHERAMDRRERDALHQELQMLKLDSEEKDKNIRMDAMKIKALTKQLEPLRRQLMKPGGRLLPQAQASNLFLTAVPDEIEEEQVRRLQEPLVVVDDRSVQVMICVVRDDMKIAGKVIVTQEEIEEQAAVRIQASFRGHKVRKTRKYLNGEDEEFDNSGPTKLRTSKIQGRGGNNPEEVNLEEGKSHEGEAGEDQATMDAAATKIQAAHRGKVARKEVEKLKHDGGAAAASPQTNSVPAPETLQAPVASKNSSKKDLGANSTKKPAASKTPVSKAAKPGAVPAPKAKTVVKGKK
mmetsp:Transcript_39855/g.55366  ORF Transcript_39855/g.55366 Transcript_39855/m.55366 type:complete len:525 (-) Transcript_39855:121-1695(-)|eukprot:CAMPEP_0196576804 /NCGR_PEP_ID=MMETSP1081-20130531/5979_1 /TAXON_ID=36882 /ORGANISM="Pyramimonas amylifera, Strain CCMP720" /LENGTH=524 /DNA_ID=CAMNT_0041895507 /DNA_START=296 /DNA_END=1870 /DNA_ORIENTATION=+